MSNLQYAASAAPNALILSPRFWYVNRSLAAVGFSGLVLLVVLYDHTYPSGGIEAVFLSLLIHCVGVWGLVMSVRTAATIEVDDALARRIESASAVELSKLKGHLIERVEVERLEALIPNNSHWDQGVIKLCQSILEEARDRKYHPLDTLTQPIRERSVGSLFHLQNLQRIALQLGILGTFIGLVGAIFNVRGSVAGGLDPAVLDKLIGELHFSFGTSIAGLQVSVMLGLMLMALRRRQERFFGNLESAGAAFCQLARRMEIADEYLVEFEQIRNAMRMLNDRMKSQSLVIKNQTMEIASGLEGLSRLKVDFNGLLDDVRGQQAHVLTEMKSVYEIISPKRTAEELEASLTKSITSIAASFQSDLRTGLAELDRYNASLAELRKVIADARQQGEVQAAHLDQGRETVRDTVKTLVTVLGRTTTLHGKMLEQFEKASKVDVDRMLSDLRAVLEHAERAAEERWNKRMTPVQQNLDEQKRALHYGNSLMKELLARPSFFDSVIVRPLRAARSYLTGARA